MLVARGFHGNCGPAAPLRHRRVRAPSRRSKQHLRRICSYFKFGASLMVEARDRAQYFSREREHPGGHEMLRQSFQRTLLFAFALLAGLAGAAGPQMGQATRQDVADASRVALAGHSSDSYAPYDYRALSDGGSYYAPGSYGSWF